jgi:hypothetical protein
VDSTVAQYRNRFPKSLSEADEELKAELYQQIGKLQVEVDWLKKKLGLSR